MLEKKLSYISKEMQGVMFFYPDNFYKLPDSLNSSSMNYAKACGTYPFLLKASEDIHIKLKIPNPRTLFFLVYKSFYFNNKEIYEGGKILAKNVRGIIFHREVFNESNKTIKKFDRTLFFNDLNVRGSFYGNCIEYISPVNSFLEEFDSKGIDDKNTFEKTGISLIYDRSLFEDLERSAILKQF